MLQESVLGGQKLERLFGFRIVQDSFNKGDRVGAPSIEHHAAVLPTIVRSKIATDSASKRRRSLRALSSSCRADEPPHWSTSCASTTPSRRARRRSRRRSESVLIPRPPRSQSAGAIGGSRQAMA